MTDSRPSSPNAMNALNAMLARLDARLPSDVLATLAAPAPADDLRALTDTLPGLAALPADLLSLFTWHDGQAWNSRLNPNDNRRLLSVKEIIEERAFFADPMSDFLEPWSHSWVPILTNDSGDFVVYETAGESAGQLIHYWHDDPARRQAYASLVDWAQELLKACDAPA